MSVRCEATIPVPEETAQVARAAFPKGNRYLAMRDLLGPINDDQSFAPLFSPNDRRPGMFPSEMLAVTFHNGGNHPKAGNKERVSADLSSSGQFTVQNGTVTGTLSLSPPGPGSFTCSSGQTLVGPTNVSYTNVTLVDQTSGAVASIPSSYP